MKRPGAHQVSAAVFLILFNLVYVVPAIDMASQLAPAEAMPDIGAWYSTWYAKVPPIPRTWIAGFGIGSARQFIADLDLDGVDDAAVFHAGNGSIQVALSNRAGFEEPASWGTGLGVNSSAQFLADVNADRRPDAVFHYNANGTWRVAINNGTGFDPAATWIAAFGAGSTSQLVGDANGDGRCDAIAINGSTGAWWVATSNGTAFRNATGSAWISGFGIDANARMIEDINHDGMGDAICFTAASGSWRVANSNGAAFVTPHAWYNGHGVGSASQAVVTRPNLFQTTIGAEAFVFFHGDVNGDGLPGDWYAAGRGCMNTGFGAGSDQQLFGNVTGDARGWRASIAFFGANGTWQVQPYYAIKRNIYDTWDAWGIKYRPWTLGAFQTYDSGNASVIDEHLATIAAAGIDFLLLDETNNLYVDEGYIYLRAKALASRINAWNNNASHRPIQYAIAIGGIQFSHDPASLEYEAGEVWRQFVNTTDGGEKNYYHLDGKPLLVTYCLPSDQESWEGYAGLKANGDKFALRWAHSPAGANNYGWEIRERSIPGEEVTIVMPGWNNNKGATPVSRQHGFFYAAYSWDIIFITPRLPRVVIINSFNEYAEETAVAPADTSLVSGATEPWIDAAGNLDPFMYWEMTISFIQLLRDGGHAAYQGRIQLLLALQAIPFAIASLVVVISTKRRS